MNGYIGLAAGFLAGMCAAMGLGGGFVLMIYLTWAGISAPDAKAANLLFFIPVALVSMLINHKSGLTDRHIIPYAAAAGSIGAVIGLLLSDVLDSSLLKNVFAALLIAVGLRELFHRKRSAPSRGVERFERFQRGGSAPQPPQAPFEKGGLTP
ncbi:MAG: sulfite exporter TauE/SafE family protein [Ruminiclostridium sp.]|nr:sulfite exporter TauE/SafE family protein [Ruminiclostridium sp.]